MELYNNIDRIEHKLANVIDYQESIFDKNYIFLKYLEKIDYKFRKSLINQRFYDSYDKKFIKISTSYEKLFSRYFDFARKTTIPINWPYFVLLKMGLISEVNILLRPGVHFVTALQGGGKSSLAFDIAWEVLRKTGKSVYVNANFEKARLDPITGKHYKYFKEFKLMEYFNISAREDNPEIKVSQLKRFNKNFDTIILDEWLTEMNHRLNRTKDYNNIFLALIEMIALMRHQGVKRVYILSQIDTTDVQLFSMIKYIHEVQVKLDIPYLDWIRTGKLETKIIGWDIYTFGVKRDRKIQKTDKVLINKQFRKATADFDFFETLNQAVKYDALPEDNIKFIKN